MGNRDYLLVFILVLILLTTLTGCSYALSTPAATPSTELTKDPEPSTTGGLPDLTASQPTSSPINETPDIPAPKPSQTLPAELVPVEPPNLTPMGGEVPEELLEEIITDLVQRTSRRYPGS
jgi:hypothetical protein